MPLISTRLTDEQFIERQRWCHHHRRVIGIPTIAAGIVCILLGFGTMYALYGQAEAWQQRSSPPEAESREADVPPPEYTGLHFAMGAFAGFFSALLIFSGGQFIRMGAAICLGDRKTRLLLQYHDQLRPSPLAPLDQND